MFNAESPFRGVALPGSYVPRNATAWPTTSTLRPDPTRPNSGVKHRLLPPEASLPLTSGTTAILQVSALSPISHHHNSGVFISYFYF